MKIPWPTRTTPIQEALRSIQSRLDRLHKPTFDRQDVEALLQETVRLRTEIARQDQEISELKQTIDDWLMKEHANG